MCICIYKMMHLCGSVYICICVCIYIYIEREIYNSTYTHTQSGRTARS